MPLLRVTPMHTFSKGDRIGRYRIESILGEGGMGLVLLARQIDLDMAVAIKVIRPELAADDLIVERLLEEARAVASLRSDHVVRVFDVARLPDGTPYLVFELVEGPDLDRVLADRGPMSMHEAIAVILDVCQGLAEAHRRGIVHRDIKPENLLVEPMPDGSSRIKISDFGIAKRSYTRREMSLTQRTGSVGSPWYMSPEQIANTRDVDQRADVWSTGVVLYEILTGCIPFPGDSPGEVCACVLSAPYIPIRSVRPELPEALEEVIARCFEKERSLRYPDVGELALGLARVAPEWTTKAHAIASRLAAEDVTLGRTLASIPTITPDMLTVKPPVLTLGGAADDAVSARDIPGIARRWPYVVGTLALVACALLFVHRERALRATGLEAKTMSMEAMIASYMDAPTARTPRPAPTLVPAPERVPDVRVMETIVYELDTVEPRPPLTSTPSLVPSPSASPTVTRARVSRARNERPDYYVPPESPTLITVAPVDATARVDGLVLPDPAPLPHTEATPVESEHPSP